MNSSEIALEARRAERELAAEEVKAAYDLHMYYEAADRGYDFENGGKARMDYLKKAVAFKKKYGIDWRPSL